jgi:hypothetical protein
MRSSTATLAYRRVRILRRIAGTKKNLWNSSLAPQSSSRSRCLSSARPLPTIDDITESEWQKEVKALKKASSQSPPTPGSPNAKFSSTSPAEVTDLTDSDNSDDESSYVSTKTLTYTGGASMPVTSKLHIVTPQEDTPQGIWPVFRLMVRIVTCTFFNFRVPCVMGLTLLNRSRGVVNGYHTYGANGEGCCHCTRESLAIRASRAHTKANQTASLAFAFTYLLCAF